MPVGLPEEIDVRLRRRVDAAPRCHHLPGTGCGVVRDRELVWSRGFGYADIPTRRAPDEHTLFRVASISKTFTATAIVQLRDAGTLQLDDPLVRHLPEFAAVHCRSGSVEAVTLRRILSHRSGLITEGPFSYWDTADFPSMQAILGHLPRTEVVIEPESLTKYSNLGFALLGEVVARVSGMTYERYIEQRIFTPLGMQESSFAPTAEQRARLATGYEPHPFEDAPRPAVHQHAAGIAPAAGLYTSVRDLARWVALQLSAGRQHPAEEQVLPGPSITEMQRPLYVDPTWSSGNCLGWMAQRHGERIFHGHGGSMHGFITQILFSVPARVGVVVLTNEGRHGAAGPLAAELLQLLIDAGVDIEEQPWQPPAETPAELSRYLGRYEGWRGSLVHVEYRDGVLRLAPPPGEERSLHAPAPLVAETGSESFRVAEGRANGELLTFQVDPDGTIAGFTLAGFAYTKL